MSGADEQEVPPPNTAHLRVTDPRSIRALAHPARLAIMSALTTGQELTATDCADLTGLSPSATAYHLKFLERYGMVEAAPERADHRHRPWRATGLPAEVDINPSTPAGASAAAAVVASLIDTTRAVAVDFAHREHTEPEQWRHASLENADLWLTAEEVRRISTQLDAVLIPYRDRRHDTRPAGSRLVKVMSVVVPHLHSRPEPGP